jgi:transposase
MAHATILPDPDQLQLLSLSTDATTITLTVSTSSPETCCPLCGEGATRVHSRYLRHLTDLPWQGMVVRVRLHTRRFFCDTPSCVRCIFTERLPGVVVPYGRRTDRLNAWFTHIGFALGGEAGARLLAQLGVASSGDAVLAHLHAVPMTMRPTPRVVSVDDFALRRGRSYGTILVDLDAHQIVDLLPDRRATTFAAWLSTRPGIDVISRDRSGEYAEGARQGAPGAIQVADRFHLLKNLGETVQRVFTTHAELIQCIASPEATQRTAAPPRPDRADSQARTQAARQARFDSIHTLASKGMNKSAIARALGIHRHTVQKYLLLDRAPHRRAAPRMSSILLPYEQYLLERWKQGCRNAMGLWREIRAEGYPGSYRTVARYLADLRSQKRTGVPLPRAPAGLSPRQALWLVLTRPEQRSQRQQQTIGQLRHLHPDIDTAVSLLERFATMIRENGQANARTRLDRWMTDAQRAGIPAFGSFVIKLRQDVEAVAAGLELPYSQGQTEGQVNKLKLIKRSMYGRAGFTLLRQRALYAATG